ncbi:(2Fe-2S)-binding protein [Clostridium saccharobutylicum]|uniref:Bacterioferritin-associated ferredoxin n=2 Tax=Clostridium saccharobutylicum TaxID=169679 RepID=U5MZ03_CLOSA|nr:(2Fe-2S)-binding protein [Clostridium saccharobutylicum]AGX44742.1 NAD(P)H-nitrite reductase [Clostridium saccharobutylicum DSM 13864]AQR92029.1 BFD-like [2Fe-2S] binding domain protein [Clostridium saccharobutylicum]AQS01931.1 BFD-like [2Fe-2S] binding domain protein [Clostridium saccharobutylicum]AQS11531.1 BFD-like [2Fe-2S] binding domain protein [Clostridium saccharobutylicum]AQS15914.1 BFD-like [2Fe-2S] binding domain protein [Clostridium saccharobutylicum]
MNDDEIVCNCMSVTVKDIKDAIANGAKSFEDVQSATGAGTACGGCVDDVQSLVNKLLEK